MTTCKNCKFYKSLYTQGGYSFMPTKYGYCNKKYAPVKNKEKCDNFSATPDTREQTIRDTVRRLEDLIAVAEYFKTIVEKYEKKPHR